VTRTARAAPAPGGEVGGSSATADGTLWGAVEAEIHLFVVWSHARFTEARIVADLAEHFELLGAYEVAWPATSFKRNLHRFYGLQLARRYRKEERCGTEPFLAVVVRDARPRYDPSAEGNLNWRVRDRKLAYRAWAGEFQVHGTDHPSEVGFQLYLATGLSVAEFAGRTAADWDGTVHRIEWDLPGHDGWPSVAEMLAVLGLTQRYAVLPPVDGDVESAPALDVLVQHRMRAVAVIGGDPAHRGSPHHVSVRIAGRRRIVRFRSPGDGHLDPAWQRHLLEPRPARDPLGLDPADAFGALLYQSLVHRPAWVPLDLERLASAAQRAGIAARAIDERAGAWSLLLEWLSTRDYRLVEPRDPTVWCAREAIPRRGGRLRRSLRGLLAPLIQSLRS
jgi:hypothetical protein